MGLRKVLALSILSGISFAFTYRINGESSEAGISFLIIDFLFQNVDSSTEILLIIISLVVTGLFIYGLVKFFNQIYEHRLAGLATAVLGFSGSLLVLLSPQDNIHLILFGVGLWIITGIFANVFDKKSQNGN